MKKQESRHQHKKNAYYMALYSNIIPSIKTTHIRLHLIIKLHCEKNKKRNSSIMKKYILYSLLYFGRKSTNLRLHLLIKLHCEKNRSWDSSTPGQWQNSCGPATRWEALKVLLNDKVLNVCFPTSSRKILRIRGDWILKY